MPAVDAAVALAEPATAGRRERRKARTRRALLDAALALFSTHGIYDTRVEDITDAADLGKGAFYNYFDSKNDLVSALLGEGVDELLDRCAQLAGRDDPLDTRVALAVRAHDAFFRTRPAYRLLFHQARGLLMRPQARDAAIAGVFRRYLDGLAAVLVREAESLHQASGHDLAAAVAGAITGYRSFEPATGVTGSASVIERFVVAGAIEIGRVGQGQAG
jgi:AcrR family transcriptional regulator